MHSRLQLFGKAFMIKKIPYISVIVTAYNRQNFLPEALESLTKQKLEFNNFEIILLTNYDIHFPILERFQQEGGDVINLKMEGDIGAFFKKAIDVSRGEILCFLDDDDSFTPNKLGIVFNLFKNNNKIGYYSNYMNIIDEFSRPYNDKTRLGDIRKKRRDVQIIINSMSNWKSIKQFLSYGGNSFNSTLSIRKSILEKYVDVLMYTKRTEDEIVFAIALDSGYDLFLDSLVLTNYRISSSSSSQVSSKYAASLTMRCETLEKELYTFYKVLNAENLFKMDVTIKYLESSFSFVYLLHSSVCSTFTQKNMGYSCNKLIKNLFYQLKISNWFLILIFFISRIKKTLAVKLYFVFRGH